MRSGLPDRMRVLLGLLVLTLLLPVAAAVPDEIAVEGDPMRGKCVSIRGLTGIAITLANCIPVMPPPGEE